MPHPNDTIARVPRNLSRLARTALAALCLCAAACVTVNIYFPAPEVREAAERIVDETWGSVPPAQQKPAAAPGKQSSIPRRFAVAMVETFGARDAFAADLDVNVSTPAIRSIKDAMKQRSAELKPYLSSGVVGVGKDGQLVERGGGTADLATKAKVRRLVDAENKDRESLYREIASANNYGAERVGDIRSIFAQTWKEKAEPGWWIQAADGSWKQK